MASERVEIVVKSVRRIDELRTQRAEIDRQIRELEDELEGLLAPRGYEVPETTPLQVGMSLQGQIAYWLEKNPRIAVKDLAAHIYADTSEQARHRVRSLLWTMKKKGRIQETKQGYIVLNE